MWSFDCFADSNGVGTVQSVRKSICIYWKHVSNVLEYDIKKVCATGSEVNRLTQETDFEEFKYLNFVRVSTCPVRPIRFGKV